MAEENDRQNDTRYYGLDDMSVMRELLQSVKGLSPISIAPIVDEGRSSSSRSSGQYQFE